IAEERAGRILRLEASGALTVLATGIKTTRWLAVVADGSLYIGAHRLIAHDGLDTDEGCVILRLTPDGSLTTVAAGIRRLEGLVRANGSLVAATRGPESEPEHAGTISRAGRPGASRSSARHRRRGSRRPRSPTTCPSRLPAPPTPVRWLMSSSTPRRPRLQRSRMRPAPLRCR